MANRKRTDSYAMKVCKAAVLVVRLHFVDRGFAPLSLPASPGAGKHFRPTVDGADPGYYVRYVDGYESWSPTKAFDEGYSPWPPMDCEQESAS